jgi:hypothetical protein
MSVPKISSVYALDDRKLLVKFVNDIEKVYDCNQVLKREVFSPLNNPAVFKSVKVDLGGYGISWNDDLDLSEYELWTNGVLKTECKDQI